MTPAATPRPTLHSLNDRFEDHESRIDSLEVRLAKYDVILERLDVLVDVLTKQVNQVNDRTNAALEGQKLIAERNDGAYRWSTVWITVVTGLIVGILSFAIGYVMH